MKTRSTVILNQTSNWGQGIPGLTGLEICVVLTKGYIALISEQDVEELSRTSWCTYLSSSSQQAQAARKSPVDARGKQQKIYMHRQVSKPTADQQVDHIDQHRFFGLKIVDNRRDNLRNVSRSHNMANQRKQVGCSSCYKGVSWYKRDEKWMAYIKVNQRRIYLGLFTSLLEAAHAYNQAHQSYFPGIHEGLNLIAA